MSATAKNIATILCGMNPVFAYAAGSEHSIATLFGLVVINAAVVSVVSLCPKRETPPPG